MEDPIEALAAAHKHWRSVVHTSADDNSESALSLAIDAVVGRAVIAGKP